MHIPNPLGKYPLVLRDFDISNPRNGELLMDYEKSDIYYIDKESGEKVSITKSIYDKIIASRLENSRIHVVKSNDTIPGEEPIIPDIDNRKMNSWYITITSRV